MSGSAGTIIKVACGHNTPCSSCPALKLSTAVRSHQLNWLTAKHAARQSNTPTLCYHLRVLSIIAFIVFSWETPKSVTSIPFCDFFFSLFHTLQPICPSLCIYIKGILCQSLEAARIKSRVSNQHATVERSLSACSNLTIKKNSNITMKIFSQSYAHRNLHLCFHHTTVVLTDLLWYLL